MGKLLSVLIFLIFAFAGCNKDYVYISTCVYKNQTDESICFTWHSHYARRSLMADTVFVIPPQGMHEMKFGREGSCPPPFRGDYMGPYNDDSIVISNGEQQIIHKFYPLAPETNNLFQEETYTLVEEKKRHRTYEYIFTDADFENAEPIEPSEGSE